MRRSLLDLTNRSLAVFLKVAAQLKKLQKISCLIFRCAGFTIKKLRF